MTPTYQTADGMGRETQKTLLPDGIVQCCRCGVPCRKMPGNPEARLLTHTTDDFGFCGNCAATEFLKGLAVIGDRSRFEKKPFDPECFRLPHVQVQFAQILTTGNADTKPEEIDWLEVIANWHLPFPKLRRRKKRKENP